MTRAHVEGVMTGDDVIGSSLNNITEVSANSLLCSLCNRRLTSKGALRQHLRTMHKLDQVEIENLMEELTTSGSFNSDLINPTCEEALLSKQQQQSQTMEQQPSSSSSISVPTIVLTCSPEQVCASLVGGDPNALASYDNVNTIPGVTDQASDTVVEAEFILSNGTEKVSILVSPKILVNGFLLQSLQTALEQNSTLRSIGVAAYKRRCTSSLTDESTISTDVILSKDLHSSEEIISGTVRAHNLAVMPNTDLVGDSGVCITEVAARNSGPSESIINSGTSQFSTIDTTVLEIS